MIIKRSMIDVGTEYTFRASYVGDDGEEIVNSKTLEPI